MTINKTINYNNYGKFFKPNVFFGDTPAGDDLVGITFWIGTMAMMAASAFFFLSLNSVDAKWRSSILVS